ncbi:MAG: germination protein YpeB, partial [Clostridia bacterium]|nr:germination protein YpeB [Clostridia bacterium]
LRGETVAPTDKEQLHALHESAAGLSLALTARMEEGDLPLAALSGEEYYAAGEEYQQSGIEEFPTLIYDGPYSESSEKAMPLGLPEGEADEAAALAAARALAGEGSSLSVNGTVEGDIPYWDIGGTDAFGREVSFAITKQGAKPLTMMSEAAGAEEGVPNADTAKAYRDAAAKFLESAGFDNMTSTYAQYYAGMAVINFAAQQEEVILYSDLVKVWVDRQTGAVIGMDATNYWYSHRPRQLPAPRYTRDEAAVMVSDDLTLRSIRLALIPVTPETEKLCYEFKGEYEGVSYIVYINAETLYEEQIFKIIDSENGQLVI